MGRGSPLQLSSDDFFQTAGLRPPRTGQGCLHPTEPFRTSTFRLICVSRAPEIKALRIVNTLLSSQDAFPQLSVQLPQGREERKMVVSFISSCWRGRSDGREQ